MKKGLTLKTNNMRNNYWIILLSIVMAGCSTIKEVDFPTKNNEIIVNNNLKQFFKSNTSPKIVLRVPNSDDKATSNTLASQDAGLLYNAIEKEFLKAGYSVRDRGLFNEIINKTGSTDYSKIKDVTDTDLILEVVNIDPKVVYSTNRVKQTSGKKIAEIVSNVEYKKYGASVEYRLIIVNTNEMAGTYRYYYKPCPNGCAIESFSLMKRSKEVSLKEGVSVNAMEEFIKGSTQDLIRTFKQG